MLLDEIYFMDVSWYKYGLKICFHKYSNYCINANK